MILNLYEDKKIKTTAHSIICRHFDQDIEEKNIELGVGGKLTLTPRRKASF